LHSLIKNASNILKRENAETVHDGCKIFGGQELSANNFLHEFKSGPILNEDPNYVENLIRGKAK